MKISKCACVEGGLIDGWGTRCLGLAVLPVKTRTESNSDSPFLDTGPILVSIIHKYWCMVYFELLSCLYWAAIWWGWMVGFQRRGGSELAICLRLGGFCTGVWCWASLNAKWIEYDGPSISLLRHATVLDANAHRQSGAVSLRQICWNYFFVAVIRKMWSLSKN